MPTVNFDPLDTRTYRRAMELYERQMREAETTAANPGDVVNLSSNWTRGFTTSTFSNDFYSFRSNTETVKEEESDFDWPKEDRLMAMKMVIRGKLLKYFKDIRQEKVATAPVGLQSAESWYSGRSTQYQYQRRERQLHQEQVLVIGDLFIAQVELEPHTITLFDHQLGKSKELESIREDIEAFMKRFLPGVKVLHHEGKQAPEGATFSIDCSVSKDLLKAAYPIISTPDPEERRHECNDPGCPFTGNVEAADAMPF